MGRHLHNISPGTYSSKEPGDTIAIMTDKQVPEQDLNAEQVVIDMPGGDQHGTTARDSQKGRKPVSFHVSLLCLGLLALIVAWDTTALTVALPVIAAQLQATTLEAMFASIAFTLAVAVSQPLYLSISDAVGRKVPLYVAILLLAVGSIVFAVAQSIMVVIIGRLIQGLGGYASPVSNSARGKVYKQNTDFVLWQRRSRYPSGDHHYRHDKLERTTQVPRTDGTTYLPRFYNRSHCRGASMPVCDLALAWLVR